MKQRYQTRVGAPFAWLLSSFLLLAAFASNAQVATNYTFSSSTGTYTPITGGSVVGGPTDDDVSTAGLNIGFTFTYNGTAYTQFGVNSNGWITLGSASPSNTSNPISVGTSNDVIAAFGQDLVLGFRFTGNRTSGSNQITNASSTIGIAVGAPITGTGIPAGTTVTAVSGTTITISANATSNGTAGNLTIGGEIRYETLGTAPNRVTVIQWTRARKFSSGATDHYNWQIRLYETTNVVEIVYAMTNGATSSTGEVGLRGASTADFNNRTTTTNWAASTAGTVNTATMAISSTVFPPTGLTYTWTPLAACAGAPTAGSISGATAVCSGTGTTLSITGATAGPGITYQWGMSNTPGGPYTNMGTSNTQATGNLTATTYFIVTITCTNSALSAVTSEYTVAINPLPVISITPSNTTFCSGSSPVSLTASGANTYIWGPSTGLSATTGATVISTPTGTLTYTVSGTGANGCIGVGTGAINYTTTPAISSVTATPATICTGSNSQLQANATLSTAYNVSRIPFASIPTPGTGATVLATGGAAVVPQTSVSLDDGGWANLAIPFGFQLYGTTYTSFAVSTNGFIVLGTGAPNTYTGYGNSFPSTTAGRPSVGAIYSDLNFTNTGTINYFVSGTAPNRMLVINWTGGQFYSASGSLNTQIILYETSNIVEVHTTSSTGNNTAVQGIQNATGTSASVVAGRNGNTWTVSVPDAYRWTPATLTYAWTPSTFLSSTTIANPLASNVTANTTYTVTASNSTCSATGTVTVNASTAPPVAPTGTNSIQCGVNVPTASVSGAGAGETYNWYTVSTGGSPVQTGGSTYTTAIGTTTTFYVAISNGVCEGPRTPVTVTVNQPDALTVTSSQASICPNTQITLVVTKAAGSNAYSYTWMALPSAGSGLTGSPTNDTIMVTPTTPGTYAFIANGVDGSCTAQDTVMVTVNQLPTIFSTTANPSAVCSGGNVSLVAVTPTGSGPASATVGTQATTGITGGPYREGACTGNKAQYLYTAAELTAAGITAGNLTSMAFNVTSIGSGGTMNNYTIQIAATSATSLTTTFDNTPGTVVYGPIGYSTVAGINTHTFSTPFFWNGTSNIVVTICHDYLCTGSSSVALQNISNRAVYDNSGNPSNCSMTTGFSVGTRPVTTFSYSPYGPGSYTWTWNPGSLNGNSVTVAPTNITAAPVTQIYTVTAVDPATTCSNTSTVSVTVNPIPATPVATNSTQCGAGVPTASVSGPGTMLWYNVSSGGTPIQTGGNTYTTSISSTTTFYVEANDGTCTSPRAAVTATVVPAPPITVTAASNTVCSNDSAAITVTSPNTTYNYVWSPASSLSASTGSTVYATPTGSVTYTITATDPSGCYITQSITLSSTQAPVITATSSVTAPVCAGSPVQLNITNTTPPAVFTVGTGSIVNGSTSYPAPYGNYYWGARHQFLITAAELTALGMTAGPITSLAFDVTAPNGTAPLTGFTISLGTTAITSITTFQTGLTQVYTSGAYTPVTGWNTHTFSTPFTWNGTDNIVVETCFNNSSYVSNASVNQSTTAYTSSVYYRADQSGVCSNTTVTGTAAQRPNMRFQQPATFTYDWTPGTTLSDSTLVNPIASPTVTTTYVASVTYTSNGCVASAPVTINVNPLPVVSVSSQTICVDAAPVAITATPATGGTFSGTGVSGNMFDPSAANVGGNVITYTYTDTNMCTNTDTATFTVNALPVVTLASAPAVCIDNGLVSLSGLESPAGGTFTGTAVSGTDFDPAMAGAGTHNIVYTFMDNNMCVNSDTASIVVNALPVVTFSPAAGACINAASFSLLPSASPSGGTFSSTSAGLMGTDFDAPTAGIGAHQIIYMYSDANGCQSSDTATIMVNALPVVTLAAYTPVCDNIGLFNLTGNESPAGGLFTGTGVSGNFFDPAMAGLGSHTITYTYTDPNGCSNLASSSIVVNGSPNVNLGSDITQCAGSVTLNAQNPGSIYAWSTSQSSQSITVSSTGVYSVTAINNDGCTDADTINVTINALPVANAGANTTICVSESIVLTANPGMAAYQWQFGSFTANSQAITASPGQTTTYVLTITDANGCMDMDTVVITVDPCVGIADNSLESAVTVMPNPSTGMFNLVIADANIAQLNVDILDIQGQLVYSATEINISGTYTKEMNLEGFAKGVYYLRLNTGAKVSTHKLIIQ
jgi:hypothetical protein